MPIFQFWSWKPIYRLMNRISVLLERSRLLLMQVPASSNRLVRSPIADCVVSPNRFQSDDVVFETVVLRRQSFDGKVENRSFQIDLFKQKTQEFSFFIPIR